MHLNLAVYRSMGPMRFGAAVLKNARRDLMAKPSPPFANHRK